MWRRKAADRLAALAEECLDRAFGRDGGPFMGIDRGEAFAATTAMREGGDTVWLSFDLAP